MILTSTAVPYVGKPVPVTPFSLISFKQWVTDSRNASLLLGSITVRFDLHKIQIP